MKRSWKTVWLLTLALILCLGMMACGGGGESEEPEVVEKVVHDPQTFTTTDGKYSFTVTSQSEGGVWAQPDTFMSADASLEANNYADGTYVTLVSQDKAGLGYTLSSYHEETISNLSAQLIEYTTESTEDITIAGFPAKKSITTYSNLNLSEEEADFVATLICVETDTQYIQIHIDILLDETVQTEGQDGRDQMTEYVRQIVESFTIN